MLPLASKGIEPLKQQAIPDAAIPDCTNRFSLVNTLGESEVDSARAVDGFQLFGGEFQIQTGEIIPGVEIPSALQ
jgi:hypothetical protein